MLYNGVGIHCQGFIERALILAQENPEYLPHWLSVQKFEDDNALFVALRALAAAIRQLQELSWNITVEGADMAYTDALEFYSQVQDACQKAFGFLARSLRIAQTPHIIRGVLPKAKLLSYPALAG